MDKDAEQHCCAAAVLALLYTCARATIPTAVGAAGSSHAAPNDPRELITQRGRGDGCIITL